MPNPRPSRLRERTHELTNNVPMAGKIFGWLMVQGLRIGRKFLGKKREATHSILFAAVMPTIYENAALQSFPLVMPDGRPLQLAGNSSVRWRERIGNTVPPDSAKAWFEAVGRKLFSQHTGRMVPEFGGANCGVECWT